MLGLGVLDALGSVIEGVAVMLEDKGDIERVDDEDAVKDALFEAT